MNYKVLWLQDISVKDDFVMKKYTEEGFEFSLTELKVCLADDKRIRIIATFKADLTPILEVLFLYFRNANYSRNLSCVTTKQAGQSITIFGSGKIAMTYLTDEREAIEHLKKLAGTLSKAFCYLNANGPPSSEMVSKKNNINAMQIHKILPRTDCGECGESGCFAFAILLINGEKDIDDCESMMLRENISNRKALQDVLQPINLDVVSEDRSDLAEFLGLKS